MPFPPPPALALRSTGNPIEAAARPISSSEAGPSVPARAAPRPRAAPRLAEALSPRRSITSGEGPTKTTSFVGAGAGEGRVLGEEAVAGMDRLAAGRLRGGDHVRDDEVALGRRGRADPDGRVGEPDMGSVRVGGRVDGDRLAPELVERPDDADGDLAPVGDEHPREHRLCA